MGKLSYDLHYALRNWEKVVAELEIGDRKYTILTTKDRGPTVVLVPLAKVNPALVASARQKTNGQNDPRFDDPAFLAWEQEVEKSVKGSGKRFSKKRWDAARQARLDTFLRQGGGSNVVQFPQGAAHSSPTQ